MPEVPDQGGQTAEEFDPSLGNPNHVAAVARAKELVAQCQLNEAVRVIDALIAEVDTMPIAVRFSTVEKIFSTCSPSRGFNQNYLHLTEAEYKKHKLIQDLRAIRNKVLSAIDELQTVVMDMEATKLDF